MPAPRKQTRTQAPARQAVPLCEEVPLLSIFELALRDARRLPLVLPDEANLENGPQRHRLEAIRQHLEEDRCPVCRRWYRNALAAYGGDVSDEPDAGFR
jgi:hypothetical protein